MDIKKYLLGKSYHKTAHYFNMYAPDFMVRWYYNKYRKKGQELYQNYLQKYGDDVLVVLCPYPGTGDVYLAAAYMENYAKRNEINNYIFCVIGGSNYNVAKLFNVQNPIKLTHDEMYVLVKYFMFRGVEKEKVLFAHPSAPIMHYGINDMMRNYNKLNFAEMFSWGVFNMNAEMLNKPVFSEKSEITNNLFNDLELKKGKTVLISPFSNTLSGMPHWFWVKLVERLKDAGYDVCTNCGAEHEREIPGSHRVFIPYKDLECFLETAGHFIGIRSGFCDIISSINCNKTIIYQPYLFWGEGTNIDYFNLKDMGLCDDAVEIELNGIEFLELLDDIMNNFDICGEERVLIAK